MLLDARAVAAFNCGMRISDGGLEEDERRDVSNPLIRNPHSANASPARRAPLVDELHDADGDGAEQEDVYEALFAQHEFSHEPRREERRGEQTDVQVNPDPFA
jgi:hypothetical protein